MLDQFFIFDGTPFNVETGYYIPFLVVLSYVVASLASYTALDLAVNIVRVPDGKLKRMMHYAGSFAMGAGIWAMHFIGMLAYKMDMYVEYDPMLTAVSILPAFAVSYFVLDFVKKGQLDFQHIAMGGVLLGIGICMMHYIGMAAMKMDGDIRYIPSLFSLSAIIAISASAVALLIAFSLAHKQLKYARFLKVGAALVMGVAICGMHYTGMAATVIIPWADCRYDPDQRFIELAISIALIAFCFLGMAVFFSARTGGLVGRLNIASEAKRTAYAPAFISFLFGCLISIFVYYFTADQQQSVVNKTFSQVAEQYRTEFRSLMDIHAENIHSIDSLFSASTFVDADEFEIFVVPFLSGQSALKGIYYAPFVSDDMRQNYVAEALQLKSDYKIQTFNPDVAQDRGFSVPVLYSEFVHKEHDFTGYDFASFPSYVDIIQAEMQPFAFHVSLDRPQFLKDENTIFLFETVQSSIDDDGYPRQAGYLIGLVDLSVLHDIVLQKSGIEGVDVFFDARDEVSSASMSYQNSLKIADQEWSFTYVPQKGFFVRNKWIERFALLGGFFLSMMISFYAFLLLRQRQKDEVAQQQLNAAFLKQERLNAQMQVYTDKLEEARLEQMEVADKLKEEKEKADRANHAKSEFLANMSHELRTPLNSIMGISQMLVEDSEEDSEERDMVRTVHKSATSLLCIVNDILDLSKIEAGEIILEKIGFDFKEVVSGVVEALAPIASEKGIWLNYIYERDNVPFMIGDPTRLSRVLTNLVGNAVKYTKEGCVEIHTNFRMLDDEMMELHCSVNDTGIGIPKDKLFIIFDKFSQADESTTRKYGGTGLGLAITKELVEMMDGDVGVKSEEGKGSTFWFKIPFKITKELQGVAVEQAKQEASSSDGDVEKIKAADAKLLVAEDHELNQSFIKKLLSRMGFDNYQLVVNGAEALQAYKDNDYDLILMDCHMPEMNGYQVTGAIREIEQGDKTAGHIPIVALTADAMRGTREKCLDAGMDDYVSKPIDSDAFKTVLSQWFVLSGKRKAAYFETKDNDNQDHADLLDMSALEDYADTLEEMQHFYEMFVKNADEGIKHLEEQCTDGENEEWVDVAHKMKGSAGMLGAVKLEALCAKAQGMADSSAKDRKAILKDIKAVYQQTQQLLSDKLSADD